MRTLKLSASTVLLCLSGAGSTKSLVHDFTWMQGHWCQRQAGGIVEEQWLAPGGGLVLGMGRTVKDGVAKAFEFLRIEARDGVPHFVAQPNGTPPTAFKLTASGAGWARFENRAHDFPQRVEYRREKDGLHAEIAGPGDSGREQVIGFDYLPCAP